MLLLVSDSYLFKEINKYLGALMKWIVKTVHSLKNFFPKITLQSITNTTPQKQKLLINSLSLLTDLKNENKWLKTDNNERSLQ